MNILNRLCGWGSSGNEPSPPIIAPTMEEILKYARGRERGDFIEEGGFANYQYGGVTTLFCLQKKTILKMSNEGFRRAQMTNPEWIERGDQIHEILTGSSGDDAASPLVNYFEDDEAAKAFYTVLELKAPKIYNIYKRDIENLDMERKYPFF